MNRTLRLASLIAFGTGLALTLGCGRAGTAPPSLAIKPSVPLAVHLSEAPTRIFSAEDEIPSIISTFEGATGSVRVTLEVDRPSNASKPVLISLNDVLFRAGGEGRISLTIKRPSPEHPKGRVTIACRSAGEESSADFEPELWFQKPGAIITLESLGGEAGNVVAEGREIILARIIARNLPHDIRVTLKAMFSKNPVAPRTNAGPKPPE